MNINEIQIKIKVKIGINGQQRYKIVMDIKMNIK